MRYIVTNYCGGENYTPSYFEDRREAYEWFYTLIIENMCASGMIREDKEEKLLDSLQYMSVFDMEKIDCLKDLERVSNGYVIGEEEGENVIQIFEIS